MNVFSAPQRTASRPWRYDIDGNKVSLGADGRELPTHNQDGDILTYDRHDRVVSVPYDIDGNYLGSPPAGGRRGSSDWRVNEYDP